MVFAAGRGVRMGLLTADRAKPALPLCQAPLIRRVLERLRQAGVREVVVNLHHAPHSLEPLLRAAGSDGFRIHRSFETGLLGTSGGLHRVRDRFRAGTFLVVNGDTLHTLDLGRLAAAHAAGGGEATLVADPEPAPELRGERRLRSERGRLTGLTAPGGPGPAFTGVWALEPSALRHLSGRPVGLGADLLPALARAGTGRVYSSRAPWFEIGTPRRYLEASLRALAIGVVRGDPEARLSLAAGARAAPAALLGDGCRLGRRARVERSVLGEGVEVGAGAVVLDSVVAAGERIAAGRRLERRLLAGGREMAL